jgi:Bifunctional DNA primase/polymerase, N-terminal
MSAAADVAQACYIAQNIVRNLGWAVFPCLSAPGTKKDKAPATPKGHKDATNDPDAVVALWRRYPAPLIGLACGERSGISVLDVDPKHDSARAWWHQHASRLPTTRAYRTRGGGVHLYFQHVPGVRNVEGKPIPGIDVRGSGGYCIFWYAVGFECLDPAPPAPWPAWLTTLFWPPPKPRPATHYSAALLSDRYLATIRDRAVERVRNAPPGTGHDALRAAARLLAGYGFTDQEIFAALTAPAGQDWSRIGETIAWGIADGRKNPIREVA